MEDGLQQYLDVAVEAASAAGKVIVEAFHRAKDVQHKGTVDLVTETDKECESLIMDRLTTAFPQHKFIGEEGSALSGSISSLTADPTWMVDPVDGTTNFVHGFPFVCVSIGLAINKVVVVGVVFNPIMNEMFTAVKGGGAYLNGKTIRVSDTTNLMSALLATEIGTKRDLPTVTATTDRIARLLLQVRSLRLGGSCALDLAGVACGRLDVFFELGFGGPWDVAAGSLIVSEAGGAVFDPSGEPFDIMSCRVAASNGHLQGALVSALTAHYDRVPERVIEPSQVAGKEG